MAMKWGGINTLTFGKHNGKEISEVPDGYLTWMLENDVHTEMHPAIEEELAIRERSGAQIYEEDRW